ncbi:hypothetical protein ACI8B_20039 [Acinetobacter proteolyticus]|uniref:Uncharacterized protein n=1 Tax=Acinetobacter proteolyticus TaxID=1776741 RepID=A0A653K2L7_9GAMM|nr:hypothetical protein ACI8B_20039 [Acinetobacter proteolyticus]
MFFAQNVVFMWFKCLILKEVLNQLKEIEVSKAKINAIIRSLFF